MKNTIIFKYTLGIVILVLFCISTPVKSEQIQLCVGKDATLECIKRNFDELYRNNPEQFGYIVGEAKKKAIKCDHLQNTVDFLELASVHSHNAEFNEYFGETVDELCVQQTICFLDALSETSDDSIVAIIDELKHPISAQEENITNALLEYKSEYKYKNIMDLYFDEN